MLVYCNLNCNRPGSLLLRAERKKQIVPEGSHAASLLGVRSGRAVVHQFPGDGLIWEPGEGIDLRIQGFPDLEEIPNVDVNIALTGYITIT